VAVHLLPVWRRWENLGDTEISEIPVSQKNPKGEKGGEKEKKGRKGPGDKYLINGPPNLAKHRGGKI
jgi:hypothetical protein